MPVNCVHLFLRNLLYLTACWTAAGAWTRSTEWTCRGSCASGAWNARREQDTMKPRRRFIDEVWPGVKLQIALRKIVYGIEFTDLIAGSVVAVKAFIAQAGSFEIHFAIVFFDELLYGAQFPISQNTPVLKHRISIAVDEQLCRTRFGQSAVARMHVHALDYAVRCEVQVVSACFEVIIFRHTTPPCTSDWAAGIRTRLQVQYHPCWFRGLLRNSA